jgi:hypothetical protein
LRIQQSQKVDLAADIEAFRLLFCLRCTRLRCSEVAIAFPIAAVGAERTLSIAKCRKLHGIELGQSELGGGIDLGNARQPEIESSTTARLYGAGSLTGNEKSNAVPCGAFAAAERRPPCASMIERLIDKPMPSPSALVV